MPLQIKSTKSFYNLPSAHRQYFDTNSDGSPGECSGLHGYDRSVHFVFAGEVDEYGWIFPFGDLKPVKEFLEYYFDHVSLVGADDPALETVEDHHMLNGGLLSSLRVLPSGVSMEMSSMFVWEHVNPYIYHMTGGRVYVERVEMKEHARNSAFVEVDKATASEQAEQYRSTADFMPKVPIWEFEAPRAALDRLNNR